jgi:hypothetical protein
MNLPSDFMTVSRLLAPAAVKHRLGRDILPGPATVFDQATFPASWIVTHFDDVNDIASGVAKGKKL